MKPFRFFQKKLVALILVAFLQCISISIAQSSNEISISTSSTQEVVESTLENTDGNPSISTTVPPTTTTELVIATDSSRCPVIVLTPGYMATHIGTSATFKAVVESYFDEALESRWSSLNQIIDINHPKFLGTKNIPFPELVINNVTFEDDGSYEIQVRKHDGWCIGNTVTLDTIGVLDFGDPCNSSKECDLQKNLVCSSVLQNCICNDEYYNKNRTCFSRTRLRGVFSSSKTTTSNITVWWNHPNQDADLVQSYNVSLRSRSTPSYNFQISVELQTNFTFESSFLPGSLYFFEITSVVFLSDSAETIFVKTDTINLVVDPLPPGPIDANASYFHPQNIFLRWPNDNYNVNWYEITINRYWQRVYSTEYIWPRHLEPGTNYTVQIIVFCWYFDSYRKSSTYIGHIQTQRVPKVTLPKSEYSFPLLSKLEITATVHNISDIPLTTAIKWQRNNVDINITDTRYIGSTEDLASPKLVINGVDFVNDHGQYYRCVATNSEGSWTASAKIKVFDSFEFLESCNRSEQCNPGKNMICRQGKCLCESYYYHFNFTCYPGGNVEGRLYIETDKCKATLRWNHTYTDYRVRTEYLVLYYALRNSRWVYEETTAVGSSTQYTFSQCILQPGRLYRFYIRSNVFLTSPNETFYISSSSRDVIMEPLPPGKIDRKRSTFSPNQLMLRWERSGQDTFLNHYRVEIDGRQQQTFGSIPKIYWTKQLTPGTRYNVTITAVSRGDLSRGPWYSSTESEPFEDWIETDTGDKEGYSFLLYGQQDKLLRGDDKTSASLKSPITIYAGDGQEGGFNFVRIGSNGVIGLGENFNRISINEINAEQLKNRRIVCPFWSDLRDDLGFIYYQTYQRGVDAENDLFLGKASKIVSLQFADFPDFEATWLVKATWVNMALTVNASKTLTFQWLLITDGQSTFTVFNYVDVNLESIENKKITIGYQYRKTQVKNQYSNTKRAFKMSEIPGNRGVNGFWIYKMTTSAPMNRDEKDCFDWYIRNKEGNIYNHLTSVQNNILCPCNSILLRFDPRYAISRFDRINQVLCYASMIVGSNTECCYRLRGSINNLGGLERFLPSAGTLLQHNPFFERRLYTIEDFKPREACCIKTKQCNLFYGVRPIPLCYLRSPFNPALNFGDPHIVTLDGKNYTFNGYGEYTMLKISKESIQFDLQARTDLATTANGTNINATIFSAFVAQDQTGSKLQVEMSRDKTKMLIRVNGRDMTREFGNSSYVFLNQNLSVRWENKTLAASFLQTSIILRVSLGVRFLVSEVVVDSAYSGFAKGLMGNFDGNATNEFILPNGTLLGENATRTERDVYFNFGQKWLVNENSLFNYEKGLSYQNYTHLEFEPIFLDEVDGNRLKEAKTKCGSNPPQACIFDYLATGDIALAESSGEEEVSAQSDIKTVENESPRITGNDSIDVEVGKTVYMQFNASDDSSKLPKYNILKQPESFTLNKTTGIAKWTPTSSAVSELSISVIDDLGAESPSIDVSIVLCRGCGNHGRCSFENKIPSENARYSLAVCVCDIGYSGENCELDTDACLNEPCPLQRNCTDLTPMQEIQFGRGYNCTDCPKGYNDINSKCEDINECEGDITNVCNTLTERCKNTEGSYLCLCLPGFREDNGTCKDIDECSEKTSGCEQICNNTLGSFECLCFLGFSLNSDNATCSINDKSSCDNTQRACEYTCDPVENICLCPIGFQLAEDEQSCMDVNECDLQPSKCLQECSNTNGSFRCYCRPGFTLNEDKISCSECEEPYFGEECSQICACGQGMDRCDPVTGCVCKSGWTGMNCTVDINECENNQDICGNVEVCQNLEGSYICNCKEGFRRNGDICEDVDECSDISLNACPDDTECQNQYGNYTCNCKLGFQRNGSDCEDIDECESGIADCQQNCVNTIGGFNCECEFGYALDDVDRKTCEEVLDVCIFFPKLNCSYGCRVEKKDSYTGYCFCQSGYELDFDNSTCKDIDECKESSTCQHNCTNLQGSFECACATGYALENDGKSCKDIDECRLDSHCEHNCSNTDGSYACSCRDGYTLVNSSYCDDIDECNIIDKSINGCQNCTNTPGSFRCSCLKGYVLNNTTLLNCQKCPEGLYGENCQEQCSCGQGAERCDHITGCVCKSGWTGTLCQTDINECNGTDNPCDSYSEECINSDGSYMCKCKDGFENTTNGSCKDIDECLQDQPCDQTCNNTDGSYICSCRDGYNLVNSSHCEDINECNSITNGIDRCQNCTNIPGSFQCLCFTGYFLNNTTKSSCHKCPEGLYGEKCQELCSCGQGSERCDHITGCVCKSGWTGTLCETDINECNGTNNPCDSYSEECINSDGSYMCKCKDGFENTTNGSCKDIDECLRDSPCDHNCSNTDGSYVCSCRKGYNLVNSSYCEDIDECKTIDKSTNGCQNCTNIPGSYQCLCFTGYALNSTTLSNCHECPQGHYGEKCQKLCSCGQGSERCDHITGCVCKSGWTGTLCETDINECNGTDNPCDSYSEECINSDGSYMCKCRDGFENTTNGSCKDIDECLRDSPCDHNCSNTNGSYVCSCRKGYNLVNSSYCEDIDECKTIDKSTNGCQNCTNIPGSYQCSCFTGYVLNSTTLSNCHECPQGHYGEKCKELCSCGQGSERCDHITGCVCKSGWTGTLCETNINECNGTDNPCDSYSEECINSDGSYVCKCRDGFENTTNGSCKDIDECLRDSPCDHNCSNTDGSYVCSCREGYNLVNSSYCEDIDECNAMNKSTNGCQNCTNIPGSYQCSCLTGYVLNSTTLSNCHECPQGRYGENCQELCSCGQGSERCDHKTGCVCKSGWTGTLCDTDINECNGTDNPCDSSIEECINNDGSFICKCKEGFTNSTNGRCKDIDECLQDASCEHNCSNTDGSYVCSCREGYNLVNSSYCEDIDECNTIDKSTNGCQNCTNIPGSFRCSCFKGYVLNSTTLTNCYNMDECKEQTDDCALNATCSDTEGGYTCTCQTGFEGSGKTCTLSVCPDFKYGVNCSNDCACVLNKTNKCDHVTGECECNVGWTGIDCSEDIDECNNKSVSCDESAHQVCVNTEGSAHCECRYGGTDISNCVAPKPPGVASNDEYKVKVEISFDFDYKKESVLQNTAKWTVEITLQLETFYRKHIQGFTRVVFLSLRFGSVIVDHEIFSSDTEENLKINTANSMVKLLRKDEKIRLFNQSVEVKNIDLFQDNITINLNTSTNPCLIYTDVCSSGKTCVDSSGVASCVNTNSKELTLIIIIGITIPLSMATIALAVVYLCRKGNPKQKSKSANRLERNEVRDNKENLSRGYNNLGYWNSIDDLLNQQKQFRIKRPTTMY